MTQLRHGRLKTVRRAIAAPEVRTALEGFGAEVRATTPAEMRALV